MSASVAEVIGALIACAGCGASLLLRDPRARYAAMGVGLVAAVALIAGDVWDQSRFEDLRSTPAALVLAAFLGATALGATAATFARAPAAFAIAAFAVLPLRVPIQVGGETNFLLLPLYGVIAGGWLRGVWLTWHGRGDELRQAGSPSSTEPATVTWLCLALATSLTVYALGIAWSEDPTNALRNVAFFLAPFAALMALLRDIRWHRHLLGQVAGAVVLVGLAFGAIALYQHASRELILNKDLKDANQLHLYFRANSLFRDPNVLGRYLVFAIIAAGAWVGWTPSPRHAVAGAAAAAILLAALFVTYSQTSFAALAVGLGALAWFRLGRRGLSAALGMGIASVALFLAIGGPPTSDINAPDRDFAEATSGRTSLVSGGVKLFRAEPLVGQGSGSFAINYRKRIETVKRPVSHTEPVTVAAEEGVLGLIPYVAMLALIGVTMLASWPSGNAARAAIAACLAALFVHSLGYAGFSIDPALWALLAVGLALREQQPQT